MTQHWQFGTRADGQPISAHRLKSESGYEAIILDQGAILQSLHLPNGQNIALGFEDWEDYENDPGYIGRIIGPNANRIANAQFQIDDVQYHLVANDGIHNLHSGPKGFDTQLWDVALTKTGLRLKLDSPKEIHGFLGTVKAVLNISLIENKLRIEMEATSDRRTPLNLTWHPYWNLSTNPRIDGNDLLVDAEALTELENCQTLPVNGTRYDFRKALPIGSVRLDNNYSKVKSARLSAGHTSITVTSSLPDMQICTGDALVRPRTGIAIEPQFRPNDVNFAQESLLRPGEIFSHWIEYRIDTI